MQKTPFDILRKETYMQMIRNAVGTRIFNSIFVRHSDGRVEDILHNGEFSCASFVSNILYMLHMLPDNRATVTSLVRDLEAFRDVYVVVPKDAALEPGDIIVWERRVYDDGTGNRHVGFYIGDDQAVSTDYRKSCVDTHHYRYVSEDGTSDPRAIEKVFRIVF